MPPEQQQPLGDHEQRVVSLIHKTSAQVRAPDALRQRIESQRPSRAARVRRRTTYGTALAGALAVLALALVLFLPNNTPGGPSVSQAAALGALGPNMAAPTPDPSAPMKLQTSVGELYFPNWSNIQWYARGQRVDRLSGRTATTVYYDWHGRRVAYTIVSAPVLNVPAASATTLNGTALRTFTLNNRLVVTWRRAGHTCILSGTGFSASELQELAAMKTPAGVG